MIQCPKCNNSLPDWVQTCQFCKSDISKVPRPKVAATAKRPLMQTAAWIWPTYYIISGYFVLSGIWTIVQTVIAANTHKSGVEVTGMGPIQVIIIIIGAITSLIGLGLLFKVELARGIVNVLCWIRIAVGVLSLPAAIGLAVVFGPLGIVMLISSIIDVLSSGLMIYLIGETD